MPFEEEFKRPSPSKKLLLIALILVVIVPTVAYATYKIVSPPSQPLEIISPATLSPPQMNSTIATPTDTVQLTTTLSDHMPGVQVFFFIENSTSPALGSAYTDSSGQAIFNVKLDVGLYRFRAEAYHP